MPRWYELAHIVGISKTAYVLATARCPDWRHDPQQTSTNNDPSDSDSQDPCRRPARRHRGDRRSLRLPVAGVLVLDGRITTPRRPSQCLTFAELVEAYLAQHFQPVRAPWCAWRG